MPTGAQSSRRRSTRPIPARTRTTDPTADRSSGRESRTAQAMRILLVEDDRMIGAAIAQALKDAAYAVDWVTDGQSATDAADVEPYDLILLDLGLPKPDGLDVLRRLRTRRQPLPVIIVTAT